MPPPYRTRSYRGYELTEWTQGWRVQISTGDGEWLTSAVDMDDAERIVDEWLNAP